MSGAAQPVVLAAQEPVDLQDVEEVGQLLTAPLDGGVDVLGFVPKVADGQVGFAGQVVQALQLDDRADAELDELLPSGLVGRPVFVSLGLGGLDGLGQLGLLAEEPAKLAGQAVSLVLGGSGGQDDVLDVGLGVHGNTFLGSASPVLWGMRFEGNPSPLG